MTHEFRKLIEVAFLNGQKNIRNVLASVVALEGSSYRKPGVRMLISEEGKMTGAVSGGCVEKEIFYQAQEVFETGKPKMMTYDGRYRLGCEGILYILLEPFEIDEKLHTSFQETFRKRQSFRLISKYDKNVETEAVLGTHALIPDSEKISFRKGSQKEAKVSSVFEQEIPPLFKLLIIGAEHDAVQLCSLASMMGWEVDVVDSPKDPKKSDNFPGINNLHHLFPEQLSELTFDKNMAVVLMNHSYVTDLKFLISLKDLELPYIGVLGSVKRREKLFNELLERAPELEESFFDSIYSPAGIKIGAETPQEIGVSIISEILSVIRNKEIGHLREENGKIHSEIE
ncbi:XdhC family protein [Gramella jeungdoensis]|uniref:XdhC family protein n=1 Tax=Gramella jeungdoensis TaxID=708091 RepID=A0ABT0Z0M5_9FLAO|nr:XdhC/CoxI family protein [Gramella jeungdoensis]MCM8569266.1 XdhC family protein [Gramella jeungdoensis]